MLLGVDIVEPCRVQAEDLTLGFQCQVDAILRLEVLRQFKGYELLDEPLGLPEGVVAAEEDLVGANPEEQIRHDLSKVTWAGVHERQDDCQARIDVGLLGSDPAEVLQAWQTRMLYDEGQLGEVGGGVVDVGDVKGITVEGIDGGPLVDVDVGNAQFDAFLQVAIGFGIGELIALGVTAPFGRIEFDTLDVPFAFHATQVLQPFVPVAGIPGPIEDEAVGISLLQHAILLNRVEAVDVEILQIGGLEDRKVDIAFDKLIVDYVLWGVLLVLL